MAAFNDPKYFKPNNDPAFKVLYRPGMPAPFSGAYRCENCGDEVACNKGQPLPPQNHRQHQSFTAPIVWRLILVTQQAA
jgi:hypothetical protein